MSYPSSITIIDDQKLRGVLAPRALLSRRLLEDILDLIELSSPRTMKMAEKRIKEADRRKSWIPLDKVILKAKKAS
ncbi:MAG: hypothetical protein Q8R55_02215 [Candidatus Taylorbacteria bacterium]|nr:hypothetical protein [Candidatus Taylorbacteria bacterium]